MKFYVFGDPIVNFKEALIWKSINLGLFGVTYDLCEVII